MAEQQRRRHAYEAATDDEDGDFNVSHGLALTAS
jgi:hypothetical protein